MAQYFLFQGSAHTFVTSLTLVLLGSSQGLVVWEAKADVEVSDHQVI